LDIDRSAAALGALTATRLVIDASAALFIAAAAGPLEGLDRYELVAPPNFPSERTSALSAAIYRGEIPASIGDRIFERLEALPVGIVDDGLKHRREALELARSLGWAKTYDAEYVVLARRLGCALLTTDGRLARGVRDVVEVLQPTSL
jgi:predicted nucleic acid-binding protein